MDNLSKEDRRKNMQNIRSKNTVPELLVMNELQRRKIYFAKHVDKIFGKPDIVFRRKKAIVFIDSDFWHYNPKKFIMPTTNVEYWEKKIQKNRERDKIVNKTLKKEGWVVLRFWESDIKKNTNKIVDKIEKQLFLNIEKHGAPSMPHRFVAACGGAVFSCSCSKENGA